MKLSLYLLVLLAIIISVYSSDRDGDRDGDGDKLSYSSQDLDDGSDDEGNDGDEGDESDDNESSRGGLAIQAIQEDGKPVIALSSSITDHADTYCFTFDEFYEVTTATDGSYVTVDLSTTDFTDATWVVAELTTGTFTVTGSFINDAVLTLTFKYGNDVDGNPGLEYTLTLQDYVWTSDDVNAKLVFALGMEECTDHEYSESGDEDGDNDDDGDDNDADNDGDNDNDNDGDVDNDADGDHTTDADGTRRLTDTDGNDVDGTDNDADGDHADGDNDADNDNDVDGDADNDNDADGDNDADNDGDNDNDEDGDDDDDGDDGDDNDSDESDDGISSDDSDEVDFGDAMFELTNPTASDICDTETKDVNVELAYEDGEIEVIFDHFSCILSQDPFIGLDRVKLNQKASGNSLKVIGSMVVTFIAVLLF